MRLILLLLLLTLQLSPATGKTLSKEVMVGFRVTGSGYEASIMRRGWVESVTVSLGDGIDDIPIGAGMYGKAGSAVAYDAVFAPIERYVKRGDTIFYKAAGRINFINLDALLDPSGRRLMDSYTFRRVSSLDSITRGESKQKYYRPDVIVYGGMDYMADFESMHGSSQWAHTRIGRGLEDCPGWNVDEITFGRAEDGTRAGFSYLRYSREEAKYIQHLMPLARVNSGVMAMEELFRMDTRRTSDYLMHISTHSFYVADYDRESVRTVPDEVIERRRYGLLFTGAGHTLDGEPFPYSLNDGLLYGEEIEGLDMSGCDLLVLSACGTALGRVTQEGIVGLQGSFKKAGVRTMLMTLWCVGDEPTYVFMNHFYGYLAEGYPKSECMVRARRDMISSDEYSDPAYWAAFIMLD